MRLYIHLCNFFHMMTPCIHYPMSYQQDKVFLSQNPNNFLHNYLHIGQCNYLNSQFRKYQCTMYYS